MLLTCFRDLWPDTLDNGNNEDSNDKQSIVDDSVTKGSVNNLSKRNELTNKIPSNSENHENAKVITTSSDKVKNVKDNTTQSLEVVDKEKSASKGKPSQLKTSGSKEISNLSSEGSGYEQGNAVGSELQQIFFTADQPLNFGPQPQPMNFMQSYPLVGPTMLDPSGQVPIVEGPTVAGVPFGYQPFSVPSLAFQEMPLVFGPQPPPVFYLPMQTGDMSMLPSGSEQIPEKVSETAAVNSKAKATKKTDLREELAKKRQAESRKKGTPDRKVYDMTPERTVINTDERKEGWSRQVFVSETEGDQQKMSDDLREKLRQKDTSKEKRQKWSQEKNLPPGRSGKPSQERNPQRISPNRNNKRMSPKRQRRRFSPGGPSRFSPGRRTFSPGPRRFSPGRNMRFSPERDNQRLSPERGRPRNIPREDSWSNEERIVRDRNSSHERRFPEDMSRDSNLRNRGSFSRSPRRSPSPFSKYIVYTIKLKNFWKKIFI